MNEHDARDRGAPADSDAVHGMDRTAFMDRLRAHLGDDRPHDPGPPAIDEHLVRLAGPGDDLVTRFTERAIVAGMHVHRTTDGHLAADLARLLREQMIGSAALGIVDDDLRRTAERALHEADATIEDWRAANGLAALYDVDAGLTDVDAAIAESGTLVIGSGGGRGRGVWLVPPVHVALLRSSQIAGDLLDLWPMWTGPGAGAIPTATTLITGPSKTADIEGVLVTGVHGPGDVHVMLLDDAPADDRARPPLPDDAPPATEGTS